MKMRTEGSKKETYLRAGVFRKTRSEKKKKKITRKESNRARKRD